MQPCESNIALFQGMMMMLCKVKSVQLPTFGFINGVDNVIWPPVRDSSADVWKVGPLSERTLTKGRGRDALDL